MFLKIGNCLPHFRSGRAHALEPCFMLVFSPPRHSDSRLDFRYCDPFGQCKAGLLQKTS